jgi:hypothetical protein
MKTRKMYIDVDGVLVVWDPQHNCIELARGFGRLMRFCKLYDIKPYWLSMWALFPGSLQGVNCLLWPKSCPTLAVPEPLVYDRVKGKTSAIDFDSDFVWIEDGLGPAELAVLDQHNARDRFFWTDGLDADCLLKFMKFTRMRLNLPEVTDWGPNWESFFTRRRLPESGDGGISNQIKP